MWQLFLYFSHQIVRHHNSSLYTEVSNDHKKCLESECRCITANTRDYCLLNTVMSASKSYISDQMYKENLSEWCHTWHRKSSRCSTRTWQHDNRPVVFTHVSNGLTLCTALGRMADILEIAYGTSCKSRRRSWMRNVKKLSYIYRKLVDCSTCCKLLVESAGMW
jgi:hypothetical protein